MVDTHPSIVHDQSTTTYTVRERHCRRCVSRYTARISKASSLDGAHLDDMDTVSFKERPRQESWQDFEQGRQYLQVDPSGTFVVQNFSESSKWLTVPCKSADILLAITTRKAVIANP